MNRRNTVLWLMLGLACAPRHAIAPPAGTPRTGTPVAASYDRTWDAVVGWFAEHSISIKTIDKASGLIVAGEPLVPTGNRVAGETAPRLADCGGTRDPWSVRYTFRVRPDGAVAVVQLYADYRAPSGVCVSTGRQEGELEALIKARAEKL